MARQRAHVGKMLKVTEESKTCEWTIDGIGLMMRPLEVNSKVERA